MAKFLQLPSLSVQYSQTSLYIKRHLFKSDISLNWTVKVLTIKNFISTNHLVKNLSNNNLSTKFDLGGEGPTYKKDLCLIWAVYWHSGLVLVDILIDMAAECGSTCWSICHLSVGWVLVPHWLGVSQVWTSVSTNHQLTVGLDSIGSVSVMHSRSM